MQAINQYLLESLKETVGTLETLLGSSELQNCKGLQLIAADILRDARAAIAKATGDNV